MNDDCVLTAGDLRVKFVRRGDRIGHVIECVDVNRSIELVESCEGSADERWPASPPVQELEPAVGPMSPTTLQANAPQVAWLIGRAGASHWSASVEARPDGTITFDVACRLGEEPAWLGSRYRVIAHPASSGLAIDSLEGCQIEPTADSNYVVIIAENPSGKLPRTVRWRYRLSWRG